MLCIKKSHINSQWIVYNPKSFKHHTHCDSYRIAKVIRDNVNKSRLPITHSIRLIESHIRVANDKRYIDKLTARIEEITWQRSLQSHSIILNDGNNAEQHTLQSV